MVHVYHSIVENPPKKHLILHQVRCGETTAETLVQTKIPDHEEIVVYLAAVEAGHPYGKNPRTI